jgi:hypothetical protein
LKSKLEIKKDKEGKTYKFYKLLNRSKILKGFKCLSSWMSWFSAFNRDIPRPQRVPFIKGWLHGLELPSFPWFGGHLSDYIRLDTLRCYPQYIRDICQIRTFGRALPPPTSDLCISEAVAVMDNLTTSKNLSKDVLNAFRNAAANFSSKVQKFHNYETHISLSTSATYDYPRSEGGLAAQARNSLAPFRNNKIQDIPVYINGLICSIDDLFEYIEYELELNPILYDAYGTEIISNFDMFFIKKKTCIDSLYTTQGSRVGLSNIRKNKEFSNLVGENVGNILLWIATSTASEYGSWNVQPFGHFKIGSYLLPFWLTQEPIRWIPVRKPKSRQTCLAEPGAKTRSLSIPEMWLNLILRHMRFLLEPYFLRDGRISIGLRSNDKLWDFLKFLARSRYAKNPILESIDFTAATDHFDLFLIESMWEGFLSRFPDNHPILVYKELITCQRSLEFSDEMPECIKLYKGDYIHRCGSFMGEGISFFTLSMYNALIEEFISFEAMYNISWLHYPDRIIDLTGYLYPTAICGDDRISIRYFIEETEIVGDIISSSGSLESGGKSLRSFATPENPGIITFCEESGTYINRKFFYFDSVKIRLLTTMCRGGMDRKISLLGKVRSVHVATRWLTNTEFKTHVLTGYRLTLDRTYEYCLFRDEVMKLPVHLPHYAGGLSIPFDWNSELSTYRIKCTNFVYSKLHQPDMVERFIWMLKFQRLNNTVEHGIEMSDTPKELISDISVLTRHEGELLDIIPSHYYTRHQVVSFLKLQGEDKVYINPYTGKVDFAVLKQVAEGYGLIPIKTIFSQYSRIMAFNSMLTSEPSDVPSFSFNNWLKRAGKFWRSFRKEILSQPSELNRGLLNRNGEFDIDSFNYRCNVDYNAWIPITRVGGPILKYGPSLKIDLRRNARHRAHTPPKISRGLGFC